MVAANLMGSAVSRHTQRNARFTMLQPDLEAVGGVRVDHAAGFAVHAPNRLEPVRVCTGAGDEAEAR